MDFRDTPDEAAFRGEVRTWLAEHLTGRVRGARARRAARPTRRAGTCGSSGSGCSAPTGGSGMSWPKEYGGRELDVRAAGDLQRGVRAGERAGADLVLRRGPVRADADPVRHRRAEAPLPPEDPVGRGAVVPGLLRAERGLRPRQRPDPRRARRRRVGDHRAEGVDDARAPRRLVLRRVPDRSRAHRRTTVSRTSCARWTSPASRCGRCAR